MNDRDVRKTHQETGRAWDETAANYERDEAEEIARLRRGETTLSEPERRGLGDLRSWCARAIHLQCAGGSDTLSLLHQGAQGVVGVDISPRMIAVARRKADALGAFGARARFDCADVLHPPPDLFATADLVYTGRGALPWIMDLDAWARIASRLLKPSGKLFVFEGHPLDAVWDTTADHYVLDTLHGDYFSQALNDQRWPMPFLDAQAARPAGAPRARERQWTLADIVNALLGAGLILERLDEYPDLYWNLFPNLPADLARRLPHTFSLLLRKP